MAFLLPKKIIKFYNAKIAYLFLPPQHICDHTDLHL